MFFSDRFAAAVKKILLPALLCVIVFSVLSPVLRNGFVNWDDGQYVTSNPALRGSWTDVAVFSPGYYHPLTTLTYKIEFSVFGLNPLPYHFTNLIVHLLVCVSAFYLFVLLGAHGQSAFIGALLFGIHPVHVEPVAWISGRKELLWGLFSFWTLICYFRFLGTGLIKFLVYSLLFFVLAVLSKPLALVIPFVILLADYYRNRLSERRLLLEKAPYFILALPLFMLSCVPSNFLLQKVHVLINILKCAASAGQSALFYARKLAAPFELSALYPWLELPVSPAVYLSLILLGGLSLAGSAWYARRTPLLRCFLDGTGGDKDPPGAAGPGLAKKIAFGAGFFLITIFPTLIISPPADRYNYVPAAGLFFLYGEFLFRLYGAACEAMLPHKGVCAGPGRSKRALLFGPTVIILASAHFFILSLSSVSRISAWKDSLTLWNDVLKKYPLEHVAYNGRGNAYKAVGQFRNALNDYTRCLELSPGYWKALGNRGRTFAEMKEYDKAIADYGAAIAINPASAQLFLNRGNAYLFKGEYASAVKNYDRALAILPGYFQVAENKRVALEKMLRPPAATRKIQPNFPGRLVQLRMK